MGSRTPTRSARETRGRRVVPTASRAARTEAAVAGPSAAESPGRATPAAGSAHLSQLRRLSRSTRSSPPTPGSGRFQHRGVLDLRHLTSQGGGGPPGQQRWFGGGCIGRRCARPNHHVLGAVGGARMDQRPDGHGPFGGLSRRRLCQQTSVWYRLHYRPMGEVLPAQCAGELARSDVRLGRDRRLGPTRLGGPPPLPFQGAQLLQLRREHVTRRCRGGWAAAAAPMSARSERAG